VIVQGLKFSNTKDLIEISVVTARDARGAENRWVGENQHEIRYISKMVQDRRIDSVKTSKNRYVLYQMVTLTMTYSDS